MFLQSPNLHKEATGCASLRVRQCQLRERKLIVPNALLKRKQLTLLFFTIELSSMWPMKENTRRESKRKHKIELKCQCLNSHKFFLCFRLPVLILSVFFYQLTLDHNGMVPGE